MPEANYLLSVSWGYIKVGFYLPFNNFDLDGMNDCMDSAQYDCFWIIWPRAIWLWRQDSEKRASVSSESEPYQFSQKLYLDIRNYFNRK